jgi:hypothetical protein
MLGVIRAVVVHLAMQPGVVPTDLGRAQGSKPLT